MYYWLSVLSGVLIAVMIAVNGTLSAHMGNALSSVLIHLTGLAGIALLMLVRRDRFTLRSPGSPWWIYSAGLVGIITVLGNNFSFSTLGVTLTLALGLFGQTLTSWLFDTFGWMGFEKQAFQPLKAAGLLLFLGGIVLMTVW